MISERVMLHGLLKIAFLVVVIFKNVLTCSGEIIVTKIDRIWYIQGLNINLVLYEGIIRKDHFMVIFL